MADDVQWAFREIEHTWIAMADGVEIINWLSRQPWNNGRVGMRGISWGAINTLQIAARQPPALMATIAIAGTDHRYLDDAHYIGGLYGRANLEWGVLCKSVLASPPDPEIVGEDWLELWLQRLESSQALIGNWSSHQDFDSYWQRGSIALDCQAIACPVYMVAGLLDTYVNPVGRMLAELPGSSKGLVGCWGHTYPDTAVPNGVEWLSEELRWWRHWLQGEDTGIMDEPQLWVFMPEAPAFKVLPEAVTGHWHPESVWPPQSPAGDQYYLGGRQLGVEAPVAPERILYEPSAALGASRPDWLNQPPDEQSKDDEVSLTFDSQPLSDARQLLGYARLKISLSAETPAAGIWVRLNEVLPDGSSWPVSQFAGSLNRLLDLTDPPALQADGESVWRQVSERGWQREDWDCTVKAGCNLRAEADTVTIEEWLEASQNGEVIFSRQHSNTIPRKLI